MLLNEFLKEVNIHFAKGCASWEEAIYLSGKPLLDGGYIESGYIEACIESVKKHGPYIVLAPLLAMPHARAPEYVNHIGISYLGLEKPVNILDDSERAAKVLIMLATKDNSSHLEVLACLGATLSDEEKLDGLINATSTEEVLAIIG